MMKRLIGAVACAALAVIAGCARPPEAPLVYYDVPPSDNDTATVIGTVYDPGLLQTNLRTAVLEINGYTIRDINYREPQPVTIKSGKQLIKVGCTMDEFSGVASAIAEIKPGKNYLVQCRFQRNPSSIWGHHTLSIVASDGETAMSEQTINMDRGSSPIIVPIFIPHH